MQIINNITLFGILVNIVLAIIWLVLFFRSSEHELAWYTSKRTFVVIPMLASLWLYVICIQVEDYITANLKIIPCIISIALAFCISLWFFMCHDINCVISWAEKEQQNANDVHTK